MDTQVDAGNDWTVMCGARLIAPAMVFRVV